MAAEKAPLNLIESWLAVELCIPDMTVAQAMRDLNEALGTSHSPQRFYEWRRGDRPIPHPVHDYMLRVSIAHAVRTAININTLACTDAQLDALAAMLTPPRRP